MTTLRIPKGFVFPVSDTGRPVKLEVETPDKTRYRLLLGAVGPLSGDTNQHYPALTFAHYRIILRALTQTPFDAPEVPVNYTALLNGWSAKSARALRRHLSELARTYVHIELEDGKILAEPLLELRVKIQYTAGVDPMDHTAISNEKNIEYRRLQGIKFSSYVWRAFLQLNQWPIRPDAVNAITSDIAAAIYLNITPNLYQKGITAGNPFKKDAAQLLTEIGCTQKIRWASRLKQIFTAKRNAQLGSILDQIDGKPTATPGHHIRVRLEENAAKSGYNLEAWVEEAPEATNESNPDSKILSIFTKAGVVYADYIKARKEPWRKLEDYEIEQLRELGYPVEKNWLFLERARSIIGPQSFDECIGWTKEAKRNDRIKASVAHFLGHELMKEIDRKAKSLAAGTEQKTLFERTKA